MGPVTRFMAAQGNALRRSPETPGWWTMLQIVGLVVLLGFFGYQLMAPGSGGPQRIEMAQDSAPGIPDDPAADPVSTPAPGATTTPATDPVSAVGTVSVPGTDGRVATIPGRAHEVAMLAFAATFDDTKTASVPMVAGQRLPSPVQQFPNAVVSDTRVVSATESRVDFVASVDADADGPLPPVFVDRSVTRTADGWAVTLTE